MDNIFMSTHYFPQTHLLYSLSSTMMSWRFATHWDPAVKNINLVTVISSLLIIMIIVYYTGAFYYLLGNVNPRLRSKINNIQLLLLAKYSSVAKFGIDKMLEPIVEDIRKLESVSA